MVNYPFDTPPVRVTRVKNRLHDELQALALHVGVPNKDRILDQAAEEGHPFKSWCKSRAPWSLHKDLQREIRGSTT